MRRFDCSWPTAFVLVFGGMPLVVFATAVLVTYPAVILPLLAMALGAVWFGRKQSRRDALAERAAAEYPFAAALVAAPLPDMPTIPMGRQHA